MPLLAGRTFPLLERIPAIADVPAGVVVLVAGVRVRSRGLAEQPPGVIAAVTR
jgi:hypothetical protein